MVKTTRKGKRGERRVVKILEALGLRARRQPRSGSIEGLPHDVISRLDDGDLTIEVKLFATSRWKTLEKMRDGADMLFLLEDGGPGRPPAAARVFTDEATLRRLLNHTGGER